MKNTTWPNSNTGTSSSIGCYPYSFRSLFLVLLVSITLPDIITGASCVDEPSWTTVDPGGVFSGASCDTISQKPTILCDFFSPYPKDGKETYDACCACSEYKPSASPSSSPSTSPSSSPSVCYDDPSWFFDSSKGYGCEELLECDELCDVFKNDFSSNGKNSYSACCLCGGGVHTTGNLHPTPVLSLQPTLTISVPPTETLSLSSSSSPSKAVSPEPSEAPTITKSAEPSSAPTSSPVSSTTEPSVEPTGSPSTTSSNPPSTLVVPSRAPSYVPSLSPTASPSQAPSYEPTLSSTFEHPSEMPSQYPSEMPSQYPSEMPSEMPSQHPTCTSTRTSVQIKGPVHGSNEEIRFEAIGKKGKDPKNDPRPRQFKTLPTVPFETAKKKVYKLVFESTCEKPAPNQLAPECKVKFELEYCDKGKGPTGDSCKKGTFEAKGTGKAAYDIDKKSGTGHFRNPVQGTFDSVFVPVDKTKTDSDVDLLDEVDINFSFAGPC